MRKVLASKLVALEGTRGNATNIGRAKHNVEDLELTIAKIDSRTMDGVIGGWEPNPSLNVCICPQHVHNISGVVLAR